MKGAVLLSRAALLSVMCQRLLQKIFLFLLTSVASSCPPSVVLAAEDAGDCFFAKRGGKKAIALLEQ